MGTLVAGTIVDRARRTLLELNVGASSASDVRWDRLLELLPLLNAFQRMLCIHKPSAYTKNLAVVLAAGAKQTLPSDGVGLCNVEHNAGAAGTTPGRAVLLVDRATLTQLNPNWMTATGTAVEHFVHDQRDPKVFYVYPRPSGTWYVNLSYFAVPPAISAANIDNGSTGLIAVDDLYDTPMHDYIVGYALLKNTRAGDNAKAGFFLSKCEATLGINLERSSGMALLDQPAAAAVPDAPGRP